MKTASFQQAMRWIILGSLLLAAACAEGGYYQPYAPAPTYNSRYYRDYYGPGYYPEQDPEYWQMWQDRSGGP